MNLCLKKKTGHYEIAFFPLSVCRTRILWDTMGKIGTHNPVVFFDVIQICQNME